MIFPCPLFKASARAVFASHHNALRLWEGTKGGYIDDFSLSSHEKGMGKQILRRLGNIGRQIRAYYVRVIKEVWKIFIDFTMYGVFLSSLCSLASHFYFLSFIFKAIKKIKIGNIGKIRVISGKEGLKR